MQAYKCTVLLCGLPNHHSSEAAALSFEVDWVAILVDVLQRQTILDRLHQCRIYCPLPKQIVLKEVRRKVTEQLSREDPCHC